MELTNLNTNNLMNKRLPSLKSESNCSAFKENKNFVVDTQTNFKNDKCYERTGDNQNNNVNDYMLSNYRACDCNLGNVLKTSSNNRGITVKDGYGISECEIDNDSNLRFGQTERRYKSDLQLFPRPHLTTPSVNRGKVKPNLESKLLASQQIKRHKQMQFVDESRVFTPLVQNLSNNVQNPTHIIQETVNRRWVRGGIPSRDVVKYNDYLNRSSDSDIVKNLLLDKVRWL